MRIFRIIVAILAAAMLVASIVMIFIYGGEVSYYINCFTSLLLVVAMVMSNRHEKKREIGKD